jgi:hypothetical protein
MGVFKRTVFDWKLSYSMDCPNEDPNIKPGLTPIFFAHVLKTSPGFPD